MPTNYKLIETLRLKLNSDAELKKSCLVSAKEKIESKIANRVFDEFPVFVEKDEFKALVSEFKSILEKPTRQSIEDFETQIIRATCDELLDKNGNIHNQLIDTLEWKEYLSGIDNRCVVSACVAMITGNLAKEFIDPSKEPDEKFTAVSSYINKNYGKWISATMKQKGIKYDPIYDTDKITMRDIITYPIKNPGFGAALLFGGFFGAALYGGYKYLKNASDENTLLDSLENLKIG